MHVLGNKWTTWHLVVSEQACDVSHKIDKSLWQTFHSIDFLHSSHTWLPTVLSCGKHGSALSIGFIPRLWFCWRLWRIWINFGVNPNTSWIFRRMDEYPTKRPMNWSGDCFCQKRRKHQFILAKLQKIWLREGTPTSKSPRRCLTKRRALGPCIRDSECFHDWVAFYSLDEIHFATRQSNKVGESKSTRLLRFRSMSGKDSWALRSERIMERSTWRLPTIQRFQKISWDDEGPIEFEWNMFPELTTLEIFQKIQKIWTFDE